MITIEIPESELDNLYEFGFICLNEWIDASFEEEVVLTMDGVIVGFAEFEGTITVRSLLMSHYPGARVHDNPMLQRIDLSSSAIVMFASVNMLFGPDDEAEYLADQVE